MKNFLMFAALIAACLLSWHVPAIGQSTRKPNIIFILADDLGYKDLGCYGNPFNKTPHLDSMAASGMKFTQSYVASPICSASRAALLTGKHPARLHLTNYLIGLRTDSLSPVLPAVFKHYLPSKEVTLAQLMQKQGYTTGIVGKWHLGSGDSIAPSVRGFDHDWLISRNGLDYYNYTITSKEKTVFRDHGTHYLTDKLTDYAVDFIDANKEKPFFLYVPYSAPHVMIVPKGEKLRNYFLDYNNYDGKYNPYYAAMLESLDEGVGRILSKVKSLGLDDNTIVIFTSDNGGVGLNELGPTPTSLDPLRAWKGHVYEGGIRVPTIVRWPGRMAAGVVNHNYFTNTDYLPTLLEIAGTTRIPVPIDGRSVWSTFVNPAKNLSHEPMYWHYPHFSNQMGRPSGAIRDGNYKLVESYETGELELFNINEDISESKNLANQYPDKVRELHGRFVQWRRAVNANMPLPNPSYKK
jgi:arylsulfatase A